MNELLFNKQVWEDAWDNDPNASLKQMKQAGIGSYQSKGFSKWAKAYNESSFSVEGRERSERIIKWIENQVLSFQEMSTLDIGAASGVFSIPLAKRGAIVTALEPSTDFAEMLATNVKNHSLDISVINKSFEEMVADHKSSYDLVFASMCPAITDWQMVKKAMGLSRKYFYISMMAGPKKNYLMEEILSVIHIEKKICNSSDMAYLLHLLYLEGYAYQSLIENHKKVTVMSIEDIVVRLTEWFIDYGINADSVLLNKAESYLRQSYGNEIPVTTGGKFGKVLVHFEN
ncbi:class I SAM-dependent methyltransferase [Peribacillus muralis]|uniref:class I SAM-dependent methyltransferase n=1 Tax=Peribacillus muralis TaxID=264697 RepID=UPI00070FE469|nr:class I SAM-dependent methyltransferase [Peribacillus muralis]